MSEGLPIKWIADKGKLLKQITLQTWCFSSNVYLTLNAEHLLQLSKVYRSKHIVLGVLYVKPLALNPYNTVR